MDKEGDKSVKGERSEVEKRSIGRWIKEEIEDERMSIGSWIKEELEDGNEGLKDKVEEEEEEESERKREDLMERTKARDEWEEMVGKSKKRILERNAHEKHKNSKKGKKRSRK